MGESMDKLIKAIKHYQDSLERHTATGNSDKLLHGIEKLARLPIRVCHLEQTGVGRTVNGLKRFDGSVGERARTLVDKWKSMVKGEEDEEQAKLEREQKVENVENEIMDEGIEPDPGSLQIVDQEEIGCIDKTMSVESNNSSHSKKSSSSPNKKNLNHSSTSSSRHSNSDKRSRSREGHDKHSKRRHSSKDSDNNSESDSDNGFKRYKSDQSDTKSSHQRHNDEESGSDSGSEESDSSRGSSPRRTKNRKNSRRSSSGSSDSSSSDSEQSNSGDSSSEESDGGDHKHKKSHSSASESDSGSGGKSFKKQGSKYKEKTSESESDRDYKNKHNSEHNSKEKDAFRDQSTKSKRDKDEESGSKRDSSSSKSKSKAGEIDSKHKKDDSYRKGDSKHRDKSSKHDDKKKEETRKESSKSHKEKESGKGSQDKKRSRDHSADRDVKKYKSDSPNTKDSKNRHSEPSSSSKSRDKEASERKKSGDDNKKEKDRKERTKKSTPESSSKSSKEKDKKSKARNNSSKANNSPGKLLDGIDSGCGASFADVLGMLEAPVYSKKKKSTGAEEKHSPEKSSSSTKQEKSSKSRSSAEGSSSNKNSDEVPKLLQDPGNLEPLDINLSSLLPSITPNYRPLGMAVDNHSRKMWMDDEALSKVITAKHQRTKVYSGNKSGYTKVPTLFEICSRILQDNLDALEYTGGVPYSILKHILEKANPDQLNQLEFHNPYLIEDTDELWQLHCQKEFRNKRREELESWREMYMRCLDEREAKLKALTANIKQSQDKSVPVRQTKLAYVDSFVKPPRNIARKQAKNGTAVDIKRPSQTPTERLNQLAKSGEAAKTPVPNPGRAAADRSTSSSSSHSSHLKPKKAPLMAKTLSLLKNRFGRR